MRGRASCGAVSVCVRAAVHMPVSEQRVPACVARLTGGKQRRDMEAARLRRRGAVARAALLSADGGTTIAPQHGDGDGDGVGLPLPHHCLVGPRWSFLHFPQHGDGDEVGTGKLTRAPLEPLLSSNCWTIYSGIYMVLKLHLLFLF